MKMNNLTVQGVKLYYRRGAKVTEGKYFLLSAETAESKNGSFSSLLQIINDSLNSVPHNNYIEIQY